MQLSDFDFDLPEELIATRPAVPRSSAKLLVSRDGGIQDSQVTELASFLEPGDRLVFNDTKVIPARLSGLRHRVSAQGATAAKIEVTLLEPQADGQWLALLKPLKKVAEGEEIVFTDALRAKVVEKTDGQAVLAFDLTGDSFDAALDAAGMMPLPPYIAAKRAADAQDKTDYQTVFAKNSGAVAAPTEPANSRSNLSMKSGVTSGKYPCLPCRVASDSNTRCATPGPTMRCAIISKSSASAAPPAQPLARSEKRKIFTKVAP